VQYSTFGFMELFNGLAKISKVILKHAWIAEARLCVMAHWLAILDIMPCGLSSLVRGWYLCMRRVRSESNLAEDVCLRC
jgi:hypothetical protein